MRDLQGAAEQGKAKMHHQRDLSSAEMRSLLAEVNERGISGAFDAIAKAYYAGFTQGYEQRAADDKKRMLQEAMHG